MTEALLKELKQLDDKIILTEVFLLESRASHAIQNLPRAKVSYSDLMMPSDEKLISAGGTDICPYYRQLDLLPATPPGFPRPAVGSNQRRRQGL